MYQPAALFIGLRYMRGRAADRFGRFVSWLSTIGITLGVMALVTVLSVMNGFERELQNNILGLMPQAILSAKQGSVNPQQLPEREAKLNGVTRVAPITTGDVVLQSARSVAVGVMLGIDPAQNDPLTPYPVNVKQSDLQAGKYNVILGEQLAGQLGVNRGDKIRVMVPSASQFTPMGRVPSQRLFTVIGTFAANSEVDGYQMLTNIDDASRLMRYPLGEYHRLAPVAGSTAAGRHPESADAAAGNSVAGLARAQGRTVPGGAHGEKYDGPAAEPDRRRRGLQHYYLAGDDGDGEAGRSGDPPDPGADAAADYGRLYGAGGQRRDRRRAAGERCLAPCWPAS